ncbi:mitochondrial fission ELM1 family protein [Marinobacterium rhizophilum]|uniref:mitochondrial fission ELM1 family protein n=1 Tax=Marinobacterium rhizophilum TaxID=420402 RepID=UPI0021023A24|nr:mitochondrial fission ELM1 family protein [Marinobacterium rhizophilum]
MSHICIISDGKPGHLNQSLGLAGALQALRPQLQVDIRTPLRGTQLMRALLGRRHDVVPQPALLIGAGHGTHLSLLALHRATGAPAVVLMRPSLPLGWFDLCLIPEHDRPPERGNVIRTQGALNRMRPAAKASGFGLILLGGPSKHYHWDDAQILAQLHELLERDPRHWRVVTSRRTPRSLQTALAAIEAIELVLPEQTDADWLPAQLGVAECCWVSADSVSMIYEALSAGCAVGLLELAPVSDSRVARGLASLVQRGQLTALAQWSGRPLSAPAQGFNEADRCARLLQERFKL